ncbi:MAG: hypothetical protein KY428_05875 [Bacteroidetes bacterium]|nr:hypothetical protein [Bacteroidota bacterium]
MDRKEVSQEVVLKAVEVLVQNVGQRMEKHGTGAFVSPHEALGVLREEEWELVEAIKSNDPYRVAEEWMDVATTCIFAVASMMASEPVSVTQGTEPCVDCDCEDGVCEAEKVEPPTDQNPDEITGNESIDERARKLMIARAKKSNIEIVDTI